MLLPQEVSQLASACTEISETLCEPSGFVPMRTLLARFRATLEIRPLLVEGMIAAIDRAGQDGESKHSPRWSVLIDSERSGLAPSDVEHETSTSPLPARWRTTIAHELLHTLAFEPDGMVPGFRPEFVSALNPNSLVKDVERFTEQYTPLLLVPQRALALKLREAGAGWGISGMRALAQHFGVSREILVSRLKLLRESDTDSLLERESLRNFAALIGAWNAQGEALVSDWPLFSNFDRNVEPSAILKLRSDGPRPLATLFPNEWSAVEGGLGGEAVIETRAGVVSVPDAHPMRVKVQIEEVARKAGWKFFVTVRAVERRG